MSQVSRNSGQKGPSGKVKVSTTVRTDTKTVTENGLTETTTTKITTEHYSDGSSSTRRETQTTREEEIVIGGTGIHRPDNSSSPGGLRSGSTGSLQGSDRGSFQSGFAIDPNSPKADLKTEDSFIEEALFTHNKHRANHSSPPMVVSRELCKVAQSWANQLAQKGIMEHSHYGYGENIYWTSSPAQGMKGDVPVEFWYSEVSHFDWNKMDFQKTTGAFTQVIWKNSKDFGIAKASSSKGTFVVAFYIPPGNVLGQFKDNIFSK